MQFLYSTFSLPKLPQSALHIIALADLLHPSPAQLPGEYAPTYTLQGTIVTQVPFLSIARHSFTQALNVPVL